MITPSTGRQVQSKGVQNKGSFGISRADEAHLMTILRDTLYSDKVLAVLREYSSNAWDAHRQAGKKTLPISVTLPTTFQPVLTIRDFGLGLSDADVFSVYAMYGASTKRQCDEAVGFLGIGSKSGFSYSDSFTVTSWHGGMKRVYVAVLDASELGEIQRLHEEPCPSDEVGVEIQIPVKPADIFEFQRKAQNLFRFFEPLPTINITLPTRERHVTPHGWITKDTSGWTAVMGCVPYRLDPVQVQQELTADGLWDTVQRLHGGLYFDIGEVHVSASREDLKYTDTTKKILAKRFRETIDAYVEDTLKCLSEDVLSPWDKRLKGTFMAQVLKIRIPDRYHEWGNPSVGLYGGKSRNTLPPVTFELVTAGAPTMKVAVGHGSRLVLVDDARDLKGFSLGALDTLVRPFSKGSLDVVSTELDLCLVGASLTGIPVVKLSSLSWSTPSRAGKRGHGAPDPKHSAKVRSFELRKDPFFSYPWSSSWNVVNRVPCTDDVYVTMTSFVVAGMAHGVNSGGFYRTVESDRKLATRLGAVFPEIYGYKYAQDGLGKTHEHPGTHYQVWRKAFFTGLLTRDTKKLLVHRHWAHLFDGRYGHVGDMTATWTILRNHFGPDHRLVVAFDRHLKAKATLATVPRPRDIQEFLDLLAPIVRVRDKKADKTKAFLLETYPLFRTVPDMFHVIPGHPTEWVGYIKLVDDAARNSEIASRHKKNKEP